jgi:phage shock protein A
MSLFERISRLVRSEMNSQSYYSSQSNVALGLTLAMGGAAKGASIGKVGILAGGKGLSLGAFPLAMAGGLAGFALYEVMQSWFEEDGSSLEVAAAGTTVGAATSATIGGVGVAVGGTAIGVGMVSMAATGAIAAVGLAGLSRLLRQGMDPETLLDEAIEQMQRELSACRNAAIHALSYQKVNEQKVHQLQSEINKWKERAFLALRKDREDLAREAIIRKQYHEKNLIGLNEQLENKLISSTDLKGKLNLLEARFTNACSQRNILKSKIRVVVMQENLNLQINQSSSSSTISALSAFERLENKVLEYSPESSNQTTDFNLDNSFDQLQIDIEQMKQSLLNTNSESYSIYSGLDFPQSPQMIAELEALKAELDKL